MGHKLANARKLKLEIAGQILRMRAEHEIEIADALIAEDRDDMEKSIGKMKSALPHYSSAIDFYKKANQQYGCVVTQEIAKVETCIADMGSKIINTEKEMVRRENERLERIREGKIQQVVNEAKHLQTKIDKLCANLRNDAADEDLKAARKLDVCCVEVKQLLADDKIKNDKRVEKEVASVDDANAKVQKVIKSLVAKIDKEKEEELKRKKAAERQRVLAAEEMERKQSAEYCLENGLELTAKAMTQIISSLDFKSDTGNKLLDKQNEARERGRFKGRNALVSGKVTKVDSGLLGGINIWIESQGKRVKCNFGGMSKSDALRFNPGELLRVQGNIDGTGLWAEDLVLTNCKR